MENRGWGVHPVQFVFGLLAGLTACAYAQLTHNKAMEARRFFLVLVTLMSPWEQARGFHPPCKVKPTGPRVTKLRSSGVHEGVCSALDARRVALICNLRALVTSSGSLIPQSRAGHPFSSNRALAGTLQ